MSQYREDNIDTSKSEAQKLGMQDYIRMILPNWYWYLLSVAVSICLATLYMASSSPEYMRKATIMINDEQKPIGSDLMAIGNIVGGVSSRNPIDNEIQLIKSRSVMEEVIKRHNLTTSYTTNEGLQTTDLYNCAPMLVTFIGKSDAISGSFKYRKIDGGKVLINNFNTDEEFSAEVIPGDTISTPLGMLTLTATTFADDDREVTYNKQTLNSTIESYVDAISCDKISKQSSILTIAIQDVVPERADDIISSVIEIYNIHSVAAKQETSKITNAFIDERLETLREELNLVDVEVAEYKRDNLIFSPVDEAMFSAEEIQKLKRDALTLEASLEMTKYVYNYASENSDELRLIPASITLATGASEALASQIELYNTTLLEFQRLSHSEYTANPVLVDLKDQLIAMREAILSSLASHVATLELQVEQVAREQNKADSRMEESSTKERELFAIMRQQKVKEQLYIYLLTKIEENTLVSATADNNARVIDAAHGSDNPVYPKSLFVYLIAIFIALVLPFAVFYLKELFNTMVRSRHDIEDAVSAPFLGEIPMVRGVAERGIVVNAEGEDYVCEAFRMLYANIGFTYNSDDVKVIMVTSSLPQSGNTFVASNLAVTLANAGKRVVLVDLNLRRCTLSKLLGHRNDISGVSSYLTNRSSSLDNIINKGELCGVDVIFSGTQPTNTTEILMSERTKELIAELRSRYDYVIIDTVPALAVADTLIVDKHVDLTLYVVRQGMLDNELLGDIEQLNKQKRIHNMATILNGVRHPKTDYGFSYYSEQHISPAKRRFKKIAALFSK